MSQRIRIAIAILAGGAALWGAAEHPRQPDLHWQAPVQAAAQVNPLVNQPQAEMGGRKLFRRLCASCHGQAGAGIGQAPNLQSFDTQVQTDGTLFWKITNGNLDRGMPSFANLPALERWQLVLHLRHLEQSAKNPGY